MKTLFNRRPGLILAIVLLCRAIPCYGAIWPFDSGVTDFNRITATFGEYRPGHFHRGIDIIPSPCSGQPIKNAVGGEGVFLTYFSYASGDGYSAKISGAYGVYYYMHIANPNTGDDPNFPWDVAQAAPAAGTVIAQASNTGGDYACHLHLQNWASETVALNPLSVFSVPDGNPGVLSEIKIRLADGTLETIEDGGVYTFTGSGEFLMRTHDLTAPSVARPAGNPVNFYKLESFFDETPLKGQDYAGFLTMPNSLGDAYSLANPASGIQPNAWYRMGTVNLEEGQHKICLKAFNLNAQNSEISNNTCVDFTIDRNRPYVE